MASAHSHIVTIAASASEIAVVGEGQPQHGFEFEPGRTAG